MFILTMFCFWLSFGMHSLLEVLFLEFSPVFVNFALGNFAPFLQLLSFKLHSFFSHLIIKLHILSMWTLNNL